MATDKKKIETRREDFATNRILVVFTYAFLLILGLMLAYRGYMSVDTMFVTQKILYVFAGIGAVGAIAGAAWGIFGKKREYAVINGWSVALGSAILAVCAVFGAVATSDGVRMMYVFVPIMSVLILIYFLYPRDFFAISVVCACTAILMWFVSRSIGDGFIWARGFRFNLAIVASIAAFVLLAAYAFVVRLVEKNEGMLKLRGKTVEIVPPATKYLLSYITAAVSALCIVVGLVCGAAVAYYLVFAAVAYLFILAVYYTVKML